MINNIEIEGRVTQGYQDQPAVRTLHKKDSEETIGYSCQIEFKPEHGSRAFIQVTDWNPNSGLATAVAGDLVLVRGALDQDSWKDNSEKWNRRFTIAATTVRTAESQQPLP